MKIENGKKAPESKTNACPTDEPVKLVLTLQKQTHQKIVSRRRKLGLTHDQDVIRLIIALYFESTE